MEKYYNKTNELTPVPLRELINAKELDCNREQTIAKHDPNM